MIFSNTLLCGGLYLEGLNFENTEDIFSHDEAIKGCNYCREVA